VEGLKKGLKIGIRIIFAQKITCIIAG